jgi:hypothetical protein
MELLVVIRLGLLQVFQFEPLSLVLPKWVQTVWAVKVLMLLVPKGIPITLTFLDMVNLAELRPVTLWVTLALQVTQLELLHMTTSSGIQVAVEQ